MFPDSVDCPSRLGEFMVVSSVAIDVRLELLLPPSSVRRRSRCVLGAAVPEAPVDEHDQSVAREDDVRSAAESDDRGVVYTEASATLVELSSQRELRAGVAASIGAHRRARRR